MSDDKTVLLCGRSVPTSLHKSVFDRVLKRVPELEHGIPYPLEMICGEQYWVGLGKLKRTAGQVMADLVDRQLVPYFFASKRDAKPLWYRLKP